MANQPRRVLITGASGYIASQILPTLRKQYETVLLDATSEGKPKHQRQTELVQDIEIVDLTDPNRSLYDHHFVGIDTVVHLGHYSSNDNDSVNLFYSEKQNVEMAYNVLRTGYDTGVKRAVIASSNHAADWYEDNLIHERKMEMLTPEILPLSSQFYGWAKATIEHMGFLFACGSFGRQMEVVMLRIGAPRHLDVSKYQNDPKRYKRDLGAYLSPRDLTQLVTRAIETPKIDNKHSIPWQVVYGISNNTRAFWSLSNARSALGYKPEDDSEVKYAEDIKNFLLKNEGEMGIGRVGVP